MYQRLMRRHAATTYLEDESVELLRTLTSAPGVTQAEIIGLHPRGGYRVRLDFSSSHMDEVIAHLERHDWMSVI
jgi:hypothetical protein